MIPALLAVALSFTDVESNAVERAPSVIEARAHVRETQALLDAARAGGLPHAIVNYTQAPQGGTVGTITQRLTTLGGQVALGDVASRQPLVAQAQADLRSAVAGELSAERAERLKAAGFYLDAIRTAEIRSLRQLIVAAAVADLRAAQIRFRAGDVAHLDVVRADVAVARANADLVQARAAENTSRHLLALEIGSADSELTLPAIDALRTSAPPDLTRLAQPDLVQRALRKRPEIAAARADVASAESAVRAAHRATFPGITAQVGYTSGQDSGINVSGPSANVTFDLPFAPAAAARARAEEARLAAAQARLTDALRTVDADVSSAYQTLRANVDSAAAAASARSEAAAEVRAAQTGYREGASSSLDLLDARRTYAQALVDDVTARAALVESFATLALAIGEMP